MSETDAIDYPDDADLGDQTDDQSYLFGEFSPSNPIDGTINPDIDGNEDREMEEIKAQMKKMEEEASKLKEMQNEVQKQMQMVTKTGASSTPQAFPTLDEKIEIDARSVYVGNVDYSTTAEELAAHFQGCGSIVRVTINCDKYSGAPKGFAYLEFGDKESANGALVLDESLFKGRQLKVISKRTNLPGITMPRVVRAARRGRRGSRGFVSSRRGRGMRRGSHYYSPY